MDRPNQVVRDVRTFGDLIDLHDEDMREGGKPPRRSEAAVMASLKAELGRVKLPALNRERLIELGRKRAKQGAGPGTLAIDFSFILCDQTLSVSQLTPFCHKVVSGLRLHGCLSVRLRLRLRRSLFSRALQSLTRRAAVAI